MPIPAVRMPNHPECWSSCSSYTRDTVFIVELLIEVGNTV